MGAREVQASEYPTALPAHYASQLERAGLIWSLVGGTQQARAVRTALGERVLAHVNAEAARLDAAPRVATAKEPTT